MFGTFDSSAQVMTGSNVHSDPSWSCFVDGARLPNPYDDGNVGAGIGQVNADNNLLLCEADSLSDGPHTIELLATVLNSNHTFWFDNLYYAPSASVPLDNATIAVYSDDPAVQFGAGWQSIPGGETTQQFGANVTFDFVGMFYQRIQN